ncbi:MAG: bepA 4 [Acidobacteria bacterium]|nr:bepA 4 [Acidobacteriota bacterium]
MVKATVKATVKGALLLLFAVLSIGMTDYDADLARMQKEIAAAETAGDAVKIAALRYRRASLTADFAELQAAERAIDAALAVDGSSDLLLLRANFNFKMHRLQRAKEDLARIPENTATRTLSAQIAMQEGDYATARAAYTAIAAKSHTWDSLASLAYYESVTGDPAAADRLYAEAENEITAKQMRSYAWVEVQRGIIDLEHRRYAAALAHYRRAEQAYSGYWLVEEHTAEVLERMGRTPESIALYRQIIDRTHNPEYIAALAAIVARTDHATAAKLNAEADAAYDAQFRLYPEAAGGHLIRHLLARDDAPLPRLVALARQNVEARPNGEAKLLLAKAYWKAGQPTEAKRQIAEVLRTPYRTPELTAFAQEVGR